MKIVGKIQEVRNWKNIEWLTYWVIWLILFIFPLIFWDYSDEEQHWRIVFGWIRILPFLIIFIIHNYGLLPLLRQNKRISVYLICTLAVIVLVNYLFVYSSAFHDFIFRLVEGQWPHPPEGIKPAQGTAHGPAEGQGAGIVQGAGHHKGMGHWRRHNPDYLVFAYNIFLSILIVGVNVIMRFSSQWLSDEQKRKEIEKEHLHSRLTALQHQVSPHFFMNTLNNIHALVDYNKEDAKEAILRLSQLMRYLLYDSDRGKTTLRKEIDFLNSYIDLMRLRIDQSVELKVGFPEIIPDLEIHPYIFIPFVENAFKFGIVPNGNTYISIFLEVLDNTIHFNVKNSKSESKPEENPHSGIGLENAMTRLEILYGNKFKLHVFDREKDFEIDLKIPNEDQVYSN